MAMNDLFSSEASNRSLSKMLMPANLIGFERYGAKQAFVGFGPDLALSNTVSDPTPDVGENITFTVTLTNNGYPFDGFSDSGATVVNDVLPSGLTYLSSTTNAGSYNATTGDWSIADVAPGDNDVLTITATVNSSQAQTDTAAITSEQEEDFDDGPRTASATETPADCFTTGTLIRTTRGDVAVERLAVGDLAVTASGKTRPIKWIGHREVGCAAAAAPVPSEAWPLRIRAGAFGTNRPKRDLYLSPGHPVLVGGGENERLVPIMCLINGTTIERTPVETVTYWHVELDEHDILLAEGLPAESYIDFGSRPWFAGADGALYDPDMALPGQPGRCRSVATEGPIVDAERRRLDAVFATSLSAHCGWPATDAMAIGF